MWPTRQKKDKEIPYRGQPEPKYPKRRRQLRNIKAERRENLITILIIFVLMAVVFSCIIFNPNNTNPDKLKQAIIVFIFTLILAIPIVIGLSSVNKFRKGYDIDTSEESETDGEKQIEDSETIE